jgi:hypothetical protein
MIRILRIILCFLLFFPILLLSPSYALQEEDLAQEDSTESAIVPGLDSLRTVYSLKFGELVLLEDHDLSTWVRQLPHVWISRSGQAGQPQQMQFIGQPVWMSNLQWRGMSMTDPVYGLLNLNFIPLASLETIRSTSENDAILEVATPTVTASEPFSQVYYRQGESGHSLVDVLFQRRLGKSGSLQAGAAFFVFDGDYSNSDVDNKKFWADLHLAIWRGYILTYRFLRNRTQSGFPGNVYADASVQFSNLRRKVRRQDQLWRLDFPRSRNWEKAILLEYHQDRREYSDEDILANTKDKIRWGSLSGLISHTSQKSNSSLGVHFYGSSGYAREFEDSASQIKADFDEFPIGLTFATQRKLNNDNLALLNVSYTYHNGDWQSHFFQAGWQSRPLPGVALDVSLYERSDVPPLGWRNGRILPFENQPWPLVYTRVDTTFITPDRPRGAVRLGGGRLRLGWARSASLKIYYDFFYQHIGDLVFPQTAADRTSQFGLASSFNAVGQFLGFSAKPGKRIRISGKYQFASVSKNKSAEFTEIPQHRAWAQLQAGQKLFKENLDLHLFLTGEYLDKRGSLGVARDSVFVEEFQLGSELLIHAKLALQIGAATIFFQWQNLTNRRYAFRRFQDLPGRQFQYGVIWSFLD